MRTPDRPVRAVRGEWQGMSSSRDRGALHSVCCLVVQVQRLYFRRVVRRGIEIKDIQDALTGLPSLVVHRVLDGREGIRNVRERPPLRLFRGRVRAHHAREALFKVADVLRLLVAAEESVHREVVADERVERRAVARGRAAPDPHACDEGVGGAQLAPNHVDNIAVVGALRVVHRRNVGVRYRRRSRLEVVDRQGRIPACTFRDYPIESFDRD